MSWSVDDDFARFGAKSYAINKINSVEVREHRPYGTGGAVIWGILAALLAFAAFANFNSEDRTAGGVVLCLLIATLFAYLAYRSNEKSKIKEYDLVLMTSSSEAQALRTRDETEVLTLRSQIESAMARSSRGRPAN